MSVLRIKAHAKINTYLEVLHKRDDGYHEISSTIAAIELHDVVTMRSAERMQLTCSISELSDDSNLGWKVLRLAGELADLPPTHVHIEKRIPIQAGLGGGSSDAGAVMRGLWHMWNELLPQTEFDAIALACGSDVTFFRLGAAWAGMGGRGERVLPADRPLSPLNIAVAKPDIGVDTATAYAAISNEHRLHLGNENITLFNDFDRVAPTESRELIDAMYSRGAIASHLCGSGSAVYGIFGQPEDAQAAANALAQAGYWTWAGKTLTEIEEPEWM